jgi:hypothetical protein
VRDLWPHDVCICVLTRPNAGNVGLVGTHGCSSDLLILEPVCDVSMRSRQGRDLLQPGEKVTFIGDLL